MTKLKQAINNYANNFFDKVDGESNFVCSPLGAWVLLAVAAKGNEAEYTDVEKSRLETVLGLSIKKAASYASRLLTEQNADVTLTGASWFSPEFVKSEVVQKVLKSYTDSYLETNTHIPTKSDLNEWVTTNTKNLITEFPIDITEETLLIAATAIVTKIEWAQKYDTIEQPDNVWGVNNLLHRKSEKTGDVIFAEKDENLFTLIKSESSNNLLVYTVLGDTRFSATEMLKHATELVDYDVNRIYSQGTKILRLNQIPEKGSYWEHTVKPERVSRETVEWDIVLPAWEAETEINLQDNDDYGYVTVLEPLVREVRKIDPNGAETQAKQVAVAKYTKDGFEAAAVTAFSIARASASFSSEPVYRHEVNINVNQPHVVVAVATDYSPKRGESSVWHRLPVFAAWVKEATEA